MNALESVVLKGALYESLNRGNNQIRKERGDAIAEDLEMSYKRHVEDLRVQIKRARRDQSNMFDFSPNNALSLVIAKDVDAGEIKDKDMQIELDIRNLEIKLELAEKRYEYLMGQSI